MTRAKKRELKKQLFWWANIIAPLLAAAVIFFVNWKISPTGKAATVLEYARDVLWAYSLIFALGVWFKGSIRELRTSFFIAGVFEILLEVFLLVTGFEKGFQIGRIISVVVGNAIAVVQILYHERGLAYRAKRASLRFVEVALILFLFMGGALLTSGVRASLNESETPVEQNMAGYEWQVEE